MSTTWEDRVRRVEEAVVARRALLLDPQTPEPGSSLAKDDETFPPMPCSQLAWWGWTMAVEHLDAGLRLLADQAARGGPYLGNANYTVLRGPPGGRHGLLLRPDTVEGPPGPCRTPAEWSGSHG